MLLFIKDVCCHMTFQWQEVYDAGEVMQSVLPAPTFVEISKLRLTLIY